MAVAQFTRHVTIGRRADGRSLTVPIGEHSTLIGGLQGTGKSGTVQAVMYAAAPVPDLAIVGLDAKRVELRPWRPRLSVFATELDAITVTLEALVSLMNERYEQMEAEDVTRWPISRHRPAVVCIVDELAELVASGEPGDVDRATLIRRLLSKGRAAAMTMICATQRPSADIIPTALRDLFAMRIAHATANRESTEMILGPAWANGPAHEIPLGDGRQGVAYAATDGDRVPIFSRVFHIDAAMVAECATATAPLRHDLALERFFEGNPKRSEGAAANAATSPVAADLVAVLQLVHANPQGLRFGAIKASTQVPEGRCREALAAGMKLGLLAKQGTSYYLLGMQ